MEAILFSLHPLLSYNQETDKQGRKDNIRIEEIKYHRRIISYYTIAE